MLHSVHVYHNVQLCIRIWMCWFCGLKYSRSFGQTLYCKQDFKRRKKKLHDKITVSSTRTECYSIFVATIRKSMKVADACYTCLREIYVLVRQRYVPFSSLRNHLEENAAETHAVSNLRYWVFRSVLWYWIKFVTSACYLILLRIIQSFLYSIFNWQRIKMILLSVWNLIYEML